MDFTVVCPHTLLIAYSASRRLFAIFKHCKWTVILVPRMTLSIVTQCLASLLESAGATQGTFGMTVESMHACCHLCEYMFTLTCTDMRTNVMTAPASFHSVYIAAHAVTEVPPEFPLHAVHIICIFLDDITAHILPSFISQNSLLFLQALKKY